uniref:Uncharacterized protein n=1 Tax=Anguilla anguilla TaxID=7936 RepID=A0A0E9UKD5_ANGAN
MPQKCNFYVVTVTVLSVTMGNSRMTVGGTGWSGSCCVISVL